MTEQQARMIACILGGIPWHTGGNHWVTRCAANGRLIVIGADSICEYRDDEAFAAGDATETFVIR